MVKGQRGRRRAEGERYPSGKLKPVAQPSDPARKPISGALWQRMLADGEKIFGDARFGTELGRLGAVGQLTPSEVATGFRIAAIYGRFEYYQGLRRSAASPHYIREFVAEGVGTDSGALAPSVQLSDRDLASALLDSREDRERDARDAFVGLQDILPFEYRAQVESLCVENSHVGHQGLIRARIGLALVKEYLAKRDVGELKGRKKRKKAAKSRAAVPAPKPPAPLNPFKESFFKVQRAINPSMSEEALEKAWNTMCALKAREDFRRQKETANVAAP